MKIVIDDLTECWQDPWGVVSVKCVSVLGGQSTHRITSPYDAFDIARWLYNRMRGIHTSVHEVFPKMDFEDRGFLESGITPSKWTEIMEKKNERDNSEPPVRGS